MVARYRLKTANFCSKECHYEYKKTLTGAKCHNWKGGKVKQICKVCGKIFFSRPLAIEQGNKFCSLTCFGIWSMKHQKTSGTDIELKMEAELKRQCISYLKQVPIKGIALVDFLLPNKIIIQCDGDFFHHSEWAEKNGHKKRDRNQDFILDFKGYTVYRFSGTEIRKSVRRCVNKVKL